MKYCCIILSYNQQKYIEAAVTSTLNMVGDEIEVVISDDCSDDNTGKITKKVISNYNGSKKIYYNQNKKNRGIYENLKKAFSLTKSDYIFFCSGDDLSYANRMSIYERYLHKNSEVTALLGSADVINANSSVTGHIIVPESEIYLSDLLCGGGGIGVGAAYMYRRDVLEDYFQTSKMLSAEDKVMPFLAAMRGKVYGTSEKIIKYRKHDLSLSYKGTEPYLKPFRNKEHLKFIRSQLKEHDKYSFLNRFILHSRIARMGNEPVSLHAKVLDAGLRKVLNVRYPIIKSIDL